MSSKHQMQSMQYEIRQILHKDADCFGAVSGINKFLQCHDVSNEMCSALVAELFDFEQELMEIDLHDGNHTRLFQFDLVLHDLTRPDRDPSFVPKLIDCKIGDLLDDMFNLSYHAIVTTPKACHVLNDMVEIISKFADHDQSTRSAIVDMFLEKFMKAALNDNLPWTSRLNVLKSLNLLADGASPDLLNILRGGREFELNLLLLAENIYSVGDYEIQVCTLEALYRLGCDNGREKFAQQWLKQENLLHAFMAIRQDHFETDARDFLNTVNSNLKTGIVAIGCRTVHLGRYEVKKPPDVNYRHFWVDFNLVSRRISLFCAQEPGEGVREEDVFWDTISINTESVSGYTTIVTGETMMLTIVLKHRASKLIAFGPNISDQTVVITFDKCHDVGRLLEAMHFGEEDLLDENSQSDTHKSAKKRRRVTTSSPASVIQTVDGDVSKSRHKRRHNKLKIKTPPDRFIYADHPYRARHVFTDNTSASDARTEVSWLNQDSKKKQPIKPKRAYALSKATKDATPKKNRRKVTLTTKSPAKNVDVFDLIFSDDDSARKSGSRGYHHKKTYAGKLKRTRLKSSTKNDENVSASDKPRKSLNDSVVLSPKSLAKMQELNDMSVEQLRCESDMEATYFNHNRSLSPKIVMTRESDSSQENDHVQALVADDDDDAMPTIGSYGTNTSFNKTPSVKKAKRQRAPTTPTTPEQLLSSCDQNEADDHQLLYQLPTSIDAHISPIKTPKTPACRVTNMTSTPAFMDSQPLAPNTAEHESESCLVTTNYMPPIVSGPSSRIREKKKKPSNHQRQIETPALSKVLSSDPRHRPRDSRESLLESITEVDDQNDDQLEDSSGSVHGEKQDGVGFTQICVEESSQESQYMPRKLSFTPKQPAVSVVSDVKALPAFSMVTLCPLDQQDESENEEEMSGLSAACIDDAILRSDMSAKPLLDYFSKEHKKKMEHQKALLGKSASTSMKCAQQQLAEHWYNQVSVRHGFVNNFTDVIGEELSKLQAEINESKRTESEILEFMQKQQEKQARQRAGQMERITALRLLYNRFNKRYAKVEYLMKEQEQPTLSNILKQQIGGIQKSLLNDMQKHELGNVKRALERMMYQ